MADFEERDGNIIICHICSKVLKKEVTFAKKSKGKHIKTGQHVRSQAAQQNALDLSAQQEESAITARLNDEHALDAAVLMISNDFGNGQGHQSNLVHTEGRLEETTPFEYDDQSGQLYDNHGNKVILFEAPIERDDHMEIWNDIDGMKYCDIGFLAELERDTSVNHAANNLDEESDTEDDSPEESLLDNGDPAWFPHGSKTVSW